MGEVRLLDQQTRVVIRKYKDSGLGPKVVLSFQRRLWWIFWKEIYPHNYTIYLRYFWGCNPKREGRSMGEMDYVIRLGFVDGSKSETWVPEFFNLDKRIGEIYGEIHRNETLNNKIWQQINQQN